MNYICIEQSRYPLDHQFLVFFAARHTLRESIKSVSGYFENKTIHDNKQVSTENGRPLISVNEIMIF